MYVITMKEIAEQAGVSSATVSKIINGYDRFISAATRDRVMHIIKENNYIPNAMAKGLKVKRTNTIGFILPDIRNPFFPEIARGIEDTAENYGFSVTFCDTDNDPKRELASFNLLKSKMVDGIIFTRTLLDSNFDDYLADNIPIVVVDRRVDPKGRNIGKIVVDTRNAMHDATKLLIDKGCREIAFIGAKNDFEDARYNGYLDALEEAGLKTKAAFCYRDDYNVETGRRGAKAIFSLAEPDGLVCGNDLIAVGAMDVLRDMKLRVPEHVG
jgi:LacI family transcriptional regulator